jgi:hypothetical protein
VELNRQINDELKTSRARSIQPVINVLSCDFVLVITTSELGYYVSANVIEYREKNSTVNARPETCGKRSPVELERVKEYLKRGRAYL